MPDIDQIREALLAGKTLKHASLYSFYLPSSKTVYSNCRIEGCDNCEIETSLESFLSWDDILEVEILEDKRKEEPK